MYTMKIVLFNILFICVISEIFATWSTRSLAQRIGSMKEKLSEEEAKQDILSLLYLDNEDGSKSVSLQNFPIKKLLKADFSRAPMFEKAKKIKSKQQETLEVVPLKNPQNFYSDFSAKYPKQYLTPSQLDDDSESDEIMPNNNNENSDETDEMLFVVRLPPNYSYIKDQSLQNKPYKDNIPPIVDGLSVEDMTVLEIPPESAKEPKNYYFKPNNKPQMNFYQNQHADGHNYKPKRSKFNKKLMQLIKRLMFKSKFKREMNRSRNPYRVGDDAMGRFTNIIKHNSLTYYDKLKEYLQELVGKLLNKAMKQREDQEKVRRSNYRRRIKRETQAGYTQDPDTCKKYNENLEKMWDTLSKYLNSTDTVNQQALHNIAVMVEAYIAHQNERPHLEEEDYHQEKKKDKISEILTKIRKLLGDENATEKVKEMVLENFKPEYDDNTECKQTNEDNLLSSIDLSYKNYLDNAKCRGDYDTGLLRGKALLRNGAPVKAKEMSDRQFYDTYVVHKNILDEAEASEEFHKGRIPANKRYKKRGRFNRWNDRRTFGRSARLSRYARQSKKHHTGLRRRPKKSSKKRSRPKKTHIRSDEACVKYANRKFLITLRTSIERFMDLRDCHQDDTLRTSNKNKNATNRRRKQAFRTSNKRKFNDMTFFTDTELGEKERRRINNYLSNIKDFNDQEINRNKSIFIVHTTSYKSPLLLKLNNKREGMHGYTSNTKQPLKGPGYYNNPSKYSFDTIYKSFLESSDKDSFDTLHSKKKLIGDLQSRHREGGIRNINLYDIIKQKVDQEKNKRPFSIVGRQNGGDGEQLDVEPITYNNTSDDVSLINSNETNLAQNGTSINFEEIGSMLDEVRNSTLQKPQIDASKFVSNNDKGYVELSYLVKYPKSIVFRPQYLVKNILQYEDFVKVASQLYVTDEDKQLMKIVRYLPDNNTQVLFETQDFKSPIEVFDVKEDIKKTKPIFTANFSESNEALRQRVSNETDIDNSENENETQIGVLPQDKINEDRLLRENEDVNSSLDDNVSSGLILADTFSVNKINTDISNIKPSLDDNINFTQAETLSEDKTYTDLTNGDSLRESSSSTDVSHLFRDDIITDDNDKEETEDLIESEISNVSLLRGNINKVGHIQEDNIATNADRVEILPMEKNDTQMFGPDFLRESSIKEYISKTDTLRNDEISIDDEETGHLPDDITKGEPNSTDSSRETKNSAYTNNVDSLQEDGERTSTEQNVADIFQENRINYDVNHTDFLREKNISTVVNREDKITTEDNKEYLQWEDKTSTDISEIDLLRQKKVSPDAYHVDLLHENTKLNKDDSIDNNEHHLEEGDFNMDFSRIDSLQEDKIDTLLKTYSEEHIADSLRESDIDVDVDRTYLVNKANSNVEDVSTGLLLEDNTEGNDVYSLRENAISTEVHRESSQFEDKNDTVIANVALRDDKTITEGSQEELLQEDDNITEINENPPNETIIGLNLNILNNMYDSKISNGDYMPENKIDVDRVNIQREDISSTETNLPGSLLQETEDTHSLRDTKIRTSSNVVDSMQEDDVSIHSVELLPDDKTSTEENRADFQQQTEINHDIDFADLLREHNHNNTKTDRLDQLKENKTNMEVNNTDYLRVNEMILMEHPRGQEETIKTKVSRKNPLPEEQMDSADSLRANKISPFIKHEDSLLKDSIVSDNNNADPIPEHEIQTKIDHVDSLREYKTNMKVNNTDYVRENEMVLMEHPRGQEETIKTEVSRENPLPEEKMESADSLRANKISPFIEHENSLLKESIVSDNNNADPLPEHEIQTKIDHVDSLREYKTNMEVNNTDYLRENEMILMEHPRGHEETIKAKVSRENPLPEEKTDSADSLRANKISPFIKHEDSLLKDSIVSDANNADPISEHEIQTKIDHVNSLRENQISLDIKHGNYLQKDNIIKENNSANQIKIQIQTDDADSLRANKISPFIKHEDFLLKDSFVSDNNNVDPVAEHEIQTKINPIDSLRENKISSEIKDKNSKITELDNVNSPQESAIIIEANNANLLRDDKITTDSNRYDSIVENSHSHEFTYSNENLPLGGADQLRNSKINAEVDFVANFEEKNINSDLTRIYSNDKISSEIDKVDLLEQGNINSGNNENERTTSTEAFSSDSLLEEVLSQKLPDSLREREMNPEVHRNDPLLEDKHSTEFNSNEYNQPEDKNSRVDHLQNRQIDTDVTDTSRENNMKQEVNSVEIPTNKIRTEVSEENINNVGNGADPLRDGKMSNEFNTANQLPVDKINEGVNQVTSLEDKISSEINHADSLREEGTSTIVVNRAELSPDGTINTDVIHNISPHEAEIDSDVISSFSVRENDIGTGGNKSDALPKNISTPVYNNKNILRVDNVSTGVNREDFLSEDKIEPDLNNENFMQKEKISSVINNGDPLPEDVLKKILRDVEIKLDVNTEYSHPQDKIDMNDKTGMDDETDMDVSNLQPERLEKSSTKMNYENTQLTDKISSENSPVTALRDNGSFKNPDLSEGEEDSTDDYRVNPLIKDTSSHEIDNSDSRHTDLLSDDNINKDITRENTLAGEEKNLDADRVNPFQEDTTISEVNTKGSLRVSNIDSKVKGTEDLLRDKNDTGSNSDSLQEDQISTNVTRSGLSEDKIEKDDLNLDARKEPRNYTEELDYLTYQDGSIAEGLNTSSNEIDRISNSEEISNPILNETSYKYNTSSALREQVIDTFNETLNSSEFINKKDDIDLNELNKTISLPDIDAESIADYLRFTLNNAEASLSTASQAYLKELEAQGVTNAAATKVLLKNWWDAWKNKLTAKVQSVAGRVTNLFKKLDKTSASNEEPETNEEFSNM